MNTVILVFAVLMVFFGMAVIAEKFLGRQETEQVQFVPSYQKKEEVSCIEKEESVKNDFSDENLFKLGLNPLTGESIGYRGSPVEEAVGFAPTEKSALEGYCDTYQPKVVLNVLDAFQSFPDR